MNETMRRRGEKMYMIRCPAKEAKKRFGIVA
jgi:hypothetical protein